MNQPQPEGSISAHRIVLWVLLAIGVGIAVTGVFLIFFYRPTAAVAYADMETSSARVSVGLFMRVAHRWLSWTAILVVAALPIAYLIDRHLRSSVAALGATLATVAASFTGYLLPWDQLALWAVTVGDSMMGYTPMFGDNVRFVLLNGVEISTGTLRRWFWLHIAVIPFVTVLLVVFSTRLRRGAASAAPLRVSAGS